MQVQPRTPTSPISGGAASSSSTTENQLQKNKRQWQRTASQQAASNAGAGHACAWTLLGPHAIAVLNVQSHWAMLYKPPMCLSCPQKSVRLEDLLRGLCCCPGRQIRLQSCPAGCLMLISAGWQVAGGTSWCGTQRQYTSIALLKRAAVASSGQCVGGGGDLVHSKCLQHSFPGLLVLPRADIPESFM